MGTPKLVTIRTTCGCEGWAGFFGYNENGDQPECNADVVLEVEEDCLYEEDGRLYLAYDETCPVCGGNLVWPQEWEIVKE